MITDDSNLPYDRTILSKNFSAPVENILIRNQQFFDEHDIEVLKNTKVSCVDYANNSLDLGFGKTLKYEKLLLATGGYYS